MNSQNKKVVFVPSIKNISSLVADAALECYGVVGLADKGRITRKIQSILAKDELAKGVSVFKENNSVNITLYLIISTGVKVTEILNEVQKKVNFVVSNTFKIQVKKINVHAVSLRKVD